jgi:E3 SUMO-protein ligase PIAS1
LLTPSHSIRLFITSNLHYSPGDMHSRDSYHITNRAIPMDYPVTPEVFIDSLAVMIKDKGLRGKAGSAPPLDLNTHNRLSTPKSVQLTVRHSGPSLNPKKKDDAKVGVHATR